MQYHKLLSKGQTKAFLVSIVVSAPDRTVMKQTSGAFFPKSMSSTRYVLLLHFVMTMDPTSPFCYFKLCI